MIGKLKYSAYDLGFCELFCYKEQFARKCHWWWDILDWWIVDFISVETLHLKRAYLSLVWILAWIFA